MTVSIYNIHTTIAKRINTELIETLHDTAWYFDNQETPSQKPDKWVRIKIVDGETRQATIGCTSTRFRTVGVLVFQVFIKIQTGSKDALELADIIASKFRKITVDDILYFSPSITTLPRQADFFQVNVSCPFRIDQLEP